MSPPREQQFREDMFVPKEQQIEGLTAVAKHVSMREFSRSTAYLVEFGFLKPSRRHALIKKMRRIKGVTYEEYKKVHEVNPKFEAFHGLWKY